MKKSILLCITVFLTMSIAFGSQNQEKSIKASRIALHAAQVIEGQKLNRGDSLYSQTVSGGYGVPSGTYLSISVSDSGKSALFADDFRVPDGNTWTIDSIRFALAWQNKEPDYYRVIIFPDNGGGAPDETAPVKTFTFTGNSPNSLTVYHLQVNVISEQIQLTEGIYWLSVTGVFETGDFLNDTCMNYWLYKDTLLSDYPVQCLDSIGLVYESYPTPWLQWSYPGENQEVSTNFTIYGSSVTSIKNINKRIVKASVVTFSNLASGQVCLQVNSAVNAGYIEIYNIKGKRLKCISLKSDIDKINIRSLTKGVYLYKLLDTVKGNIAGGRFTFSK